MKHALAGLILAALIAPAAAQPIVYDEPITLKSQSRSAEIEVALSRAAEREPALFRLLAADARTHITEFDTRARTDFAEYGDEEFWRTYSLIAAYEDRLVVPDFIGVLSSSYEYTGGAHGNTYFTAYLFDTKADKPVDLDDLFGSLPDDAPVLVAIADAVRTALTEEKKRRFTNVEGFDPEADPALATVRASKAFLNVFTAEPSTEAGKLGGLTFHFAPYVVGAYAEGSYTATVPQSVFASYLSEQYKAAFAGEPRIASRLVVAGEPVSSVCLRDVSGNGPIAKTATLAGEVPRHWFSDGEPTVTFFDSEGAEKGSVALTASETQPGECGYETVRFESSLAIDAPAGTSGRLVFMTSDPRPLPRRFTDETGPAQAEITVTVTE